MKRRIIVVGGGSGGTIVANRLAGHLSSEIRSQAVEVTVVNETSYQLYKPLTLYMAFGKNEESEAERPVRELLNEDLPFIQDRGVGLDLGSKELELASGSSLSYDYLVLATGSKLALGRVPGLKESSHHFYGPKGSIKLREELAEFEEGHLVVSVVGVPHMCPVAPMEFSFIADSWFRERGLRDDVKITYTFPGEEMIGKKNIVEWATPLLEERDINLESGFEVTEVDPDGEVLKSSGGEEMEFDLLVSIPPHRGDDLVTGADLGEGEWIETDKHTLEAKRAEDVYAIGDATDLSTSMAGSVAHYQSGVVAERLASQVRGEVPTARYDGKTICFIDGVDGDKATFLEFNYGEEPDIPPESKLIHWAKHSYNKAYWLTAKGLL